jgi:hypothetical protein
MYGDPVGHSGLMGTAIPPPVEPTHAQKIMDLQSRVVQLEKMVSELVGHMIGTVGANLKL